MRWEEVEPVVKELLEMPINSSEEFRSFINRVTNFFDNVREEAGWLYIKMTVNADKEEYAKAYEEFQKNVIARLKPYEQKIKEKIVENERFAPRGYEYMVKILRNDVELFREENVPLQVKEAIMAKNYGTLVGNIEVEFRGEKKTVQQLSVYLKDPDRSTRELAWRKRYEGIWEVRDRLNHLFDELKELRHQQALYAGFSNYRDYMHKLKGRFEYSPEDLYEFHEAVEKEVIPYLVERTKIRQKKLGVDSVKPWDTVVDVDGKVLKPFSSIDEFVQKTEKALSKLNSLFAERLRIMKEKGLLDLENRKGKAPGGYNHTLPKTGAPFIFMNAVGQTADVRTLFHELGHSMHSFETLSLPVFYRPHRMEVAELASMSMELISMKYWDEFYEDGDLKKAKIEELEGTLYFLPWCMTVDAFQHWIYTNPNHTSKEREEYFAYLMDRFNPGVDWEGLDEEKKTRWLFQLHIFEVPFYYIEYGIAQIGALAIYRNYLENPEKTLEDYQKFLAMGCSAPIDEVYKTAGIELNFSRDYLKNIVDFVAGEIEKLEKDM
ncbi:M3 family oligoendopeptidase [Thermotoga sp. KOL6]|uniref:M3 family oligoendopeptidase n=1 Tax=Thermotoga sp. KOL6 TaxID=126741 RepID=UPI000C769003|nr:M3 family oligoendopeptidase [Thermotoga sp. KOL6]PLV59750.1 oligoendopeptidase F [Thermotoga sp. KOL6]